MMHRFHPLNCIIPPYMLRQIAERGSPPQRDWAVKTMRLTDQMRDDRTQITLGTQLPVIKNAVPGEVRAVYDAQNSSTLPGILVRREGDPAVADVSVNEAYDGAGTTYTFYQQIYNRNSIDDQGMRIDSTVHYQRSFDNAFWNGEQMVYGDGDDDLPPEQRIFNRFTIALDIIGHELSHGVMQYEDNLTYMGQSGALNEHFSDVFGSMVKQFSRKQTAQAADWIIGEGIFSPNVRGVGVRSMKAPGTAYDDPLLGKDPQPADMSGYINTIDDNGGVHLNSGIPNRAFYLAATEIGGYTWEKTGKIWYTTLRKRLSVGATFLDAANTTYTVAGELFGANSAEQLAVLHGWAGVGITINVPGGGAGGGAGGSTNPGCLNSLLGLFKPGTK